MWGWSEDGELSYLSRWYAAGFLNEDREDIVVRRVQGQEAIFVGRVWSVVRCVA
jgi:hypothetical protein